jgi:hypothetical protein
LLPGESDLPRTINNTLAKLDEGIIKSLEGETVKSLILSPEAMAFEILKKDKRQS